MVASRRGIQSAQILNAVECHQPSPRQHAIGLPYRSRGLGSTDFDEWSCRALLRGRPICKRASGYPGELEGILRSVRLWVHKY